MRLTGAQVEDLLKEIIAEDSEYQELLIADRLKMHKGSKTELLERLIEKAWDAVFVRTGIVTFDEMEADLRSEPGPVVQMPFLHVKAQVFEYIDNGGNIREYLLRKMNIVFNHLKLNDSFMETIDSPEGPWQNALEAFWVLCLLFEFRKKPANAIGDWPYQKFKSKSYAAYFLFCEEIPDEYRPTIDKEGYDFRVKQNEGLETEGSVRWKKLSDDLGYHDKEGKGLLVYYQSIQSAYVNATRNGKSGGLQPYIQSIGLLILSPAGKTKFNAMKRIVKK